MSTYILCSYRVCTAIIHLRRRVSISIYDSIYSIYVVIRIYIYIKYHFIEI